jgi:leucyl aminopeptidase (aminopeptidase T)
MNWKITVVFVIGIMISACQTTTPPPTNNANNAAPPKPSATPAAQTSDTSKKAPPTDLQELAKRIVTQSAGVKEGESVMVNGSARDMELLEDIVTEVEKVGGQPLLSINSERITKRSYTEVPEKYDSQEPKFGLAMARITDVSIFVDSSETEGLLADIPNISARSAARSKAGLPVNEESRKHKTRFVEVGNELYPTEWRAKRFDMTTDAFAKLFWEGVNIDYTNLQAAGEKARTALIGKELEITHPNGTDLKMNIQGRPVYISDGIISADDVAKGSFDVFLPAGEAAITPVANSGDGTFIIEKDYFQGKEVGNVKLTFAGGKLTTMTGEGPGFEAMKADYEANPAGKELLGYVDIGINPNFLLSPGSKLGNWVSAGMVSVGTGNNTWANGTNNVSGGAGGHLAGCTVKLDGKIIVENGTLKF